MKKKISLNESVFGTPRDQIADRIMSLIDRRRGLTPIEETMLDQAWRSGSMVRLMHVEKNLLEGLS